jgi:hypothetical protein
MDQFPVCCRLADLPAQVVPISLALVADGMNLIRVDERTVAG